MIFFIKIYVKYSLLEYKYNYLSIVYYLDPRKTSTTTVGQIWSLDVPHDRSKCYNGSPIFKSHISYILCIHLDYNNCIVIPNKHFLFLTIIQKLV